MSTPDPHEPAVWRWVGRLEVAFGVSLVIAGGASKVVRGDPRVVWMWLFGISTLLFSSMLVLGRYHAKAPSDERSPG